MRNINRIVCSCGGEPSPVPTTDDEELRHGCGRRECCVNAYQCPQCGTRWTFDLEAPEIE